jgi:myo-inositol 2-dehydrogenase/D-chiro-inositol 1-dehydrogenase
MAVGVVGAGGMGARHALNLHARVADARVGGVTDVDLARAKAVAGRCGSASVFPDARALIEDRSIDAVLIASPDVTHTELTLECLRNDKPVLCEKPLATTSIDALRIVEEEVVLGKRLVWVAFMRRYDPSHVNVKGAAVRGDIGRPVLFKGWHRNVRPATASTEFVSVEAAVHDLDSARWMLEQEIEEVYARGVNTDPTLGNDTLDLQLIQLTLSGGCLATIEVYVAADYGYEVGVELVGERGTAQTAPASTAVVRRDRAQSQLIEYDWLERFETAYVVELDHWISSLKEGQAGGPSSWDGYMSLMAAEACLASLRSGLPQRLPTLEKPTLYHDSGLD